MVAGEILIGQILFKLNFCFFLVFFRFLCSCHALVGQSSEQAARTKKGVLIRGDLSKPDSILWLKAEKCKITELGTTQHMVLQAGGKTIFT